MIRTEASDKWVRGRLGGLCAFSDACVGFARRMRTTNVYVDGFNLYYGCLKGTPHKWLDLDALAGLGPGAVVGERLTLHPGEQKPGPRNVAVIAAGTK